MAAKIEKRAGGAAHAPDLDSDRLAVQDLEPLLELGNDQGWFKERLYLIHILYDEITTYDHAVTRPWTITMDSQSSVNLEDQQAKWQPLAPTRKRRLPAPAEPLH